MMMNNLHKTQLYNILIDVYTYIYISCVSLNLLVKSNNLNYVLIYVIIALKFTTLLK